MKKNLLVICFCLVAYLILAQTIFIPFFSDYYVYLIKPLSFVVLALLSNSLLGDKYVRQINKRRMIELIIIITLSYVIFYYLSGLFFGFTHSTNSTSFLGIIKNIYSNFSVLFCIEYIRYKVLNYPSKANIWLIIFISLVFTLTEISYIDVINSINKVNFYEFLFGSLIPLICFNFIYSKIVMVNSYKGSLIYRGFPLLLTLIVPIFPSWNWYLLGCLQVVFVTITYILIRSSIFKYNDERKEREKTNYVGTSIFVCLIVLLVMFIYGTFKYVPIAVLSNSMYPVFQRGDVLIYEKVKPEDLEVGQVLVFQYDDKIVFHRIKELTWKNKEVYIITKGDNLDNPDTQITTSKEVIGRVLYKIPAIGYPSVLLYEMTK